MDNIDKITIQLFGSDNCEHCSKMKKNLDNLSIDYIFIDVDAEHNDAICADSKIDEIPVIQAFSNKTANIIYEYVGYIPVVEFLAELFIEIDKKAEEEDQEQPETIGVQGINEQIIQQTRHKRSGCGCGQPKQQNKDKAE